MTTTRLAMVFVLLLVLLAQAWGLVSVWRDDPLRTLADTGKGKERVQAAMPERSVSMQPVVVGVPPDLDEGYIFNAERSFAGGTGKNGQSKNAANVAIDKIHYSGSIITGSKPRALLSYALGGQADSSVGGLGAQKQGFLRVTLGDTVNGYKVMEILPEKIIFSRDGQKITKLLYDKAKVRGQEPASLSTREQTRQIPAASPQTPAPQETNPPQLKQTGDPPPWKYTPRKQLQPPPPSDEALRKKPLRKRPEPPPL